MNCVKSGCYQFSQHWNYNNCELRPHSKAKRIVVGELQLINSDSALHQIPQRDHKTRRTIAESLSYTPMLLPTLLATAGPVWDLGLLPSDSLRDPSSVQRARGCHKLFHNVRTGLVMEQMNIWVCQMQMKKYQNTNTDKVRTGSVAGGINEEQLNSWVCQRPRLPWIRSNPLHKTRHNQHGSLGKGCIFA